MLTKDLQTLNLKFGQVMFNSLVLTWERNFEVTFGIFSVLVSQINVLESYLDISSVLKLVMIKNVKIVIISAFKSKFYQVSEKLWLLITEKLIFSLPNFGIYFHFSASIIRLFRSSRLKKCITIPVPFDCVINRE